MLPVQPASRSDAARFTVAPFTGGGLAYDAVSRRFVIGDAHDRKLFVVSLDGRQTTDMVRADSAGFEDVAALDIDDRRGDLWVAGAGGALHRLQLVSGRPLKTYHAAPAAGATRFADLSVTPSGTVVCLDAEGSRLLTLPRGSETVQVAMPLDLPGVRSLVMESDDSGIVASDRGLSRIDLRAKSVSAIAMPKAPRAKGGPNADPGAGWPDELKGIERLRLHRGALIALQRTGSGSRILRVDFNSSGGSGGRRAGKDAVIVAKATVIDEQASSLDRPFLAVDGDELYYVTRDDARRDDAPVEAGRSAYVVRRLQLR